MNRDPGSLIFIRNYNELRPEMDRQFAAAEDRAVRPFKVAAWAFFAVLLFALSL